MIASKLPIKLKKEPLIDAIFAIQFSSSTSASTVLPGLLFSKLDEKGKKIERLPIADFPVQIRNDNPILRLQPLVKLDLGNFLVLIGDNNLSVATVMPYCGWAAFKEKIIQIFGLLGDMKIIDTIDRYSMKYVSVVGGTSIADQINKINMAVKLGSHQLTAETFNIRIEIPRHDLLHIVQIAAPAVAALPDGQSRTGVVIDIDTLCNYQTSELATLFTELPDRLEKIHTGNKEMFFECLKPETIESMEPLYG
jgi:uncharacterized protein (TIGR04255 family)